MKNILIIDIYPIQKNSIIDFFEERNVNVEILTIYKQKKKIFYNKLEIILREVYILFYLLLHLNQLKGKQILCLGGHYSVCLLNKLFRFYLGKSVRIFIYNFYIHSAEQSNVVRKILKFIFIPRNIFLLVQSPREQTVYKEFTKNEVSFIPFCSNQFKAKEEDISIRIDKPYLFSGGYTNRDYPLLLKLAKENPDKLFVFVASALNTELNRLSQYTNVIIYKDISRPDFYSLVQNASIVIIPLKQDVGSSGQMLCINAMSFSRPIIYTDVSSVNYYFSQGTGYPYKIGDFESLNSAVNELYLNKEMAKEMGEATYEYYKCHFTEERRNSDLYTILFKKIC